jgi:D-lactate dehydrogenase (cytochrome)
MNPVTAETIQVLESIVGQERISTAEAFRAQHASDESSHPAHLPDVVVWPRTTAEVRAILRHANEQGIAVTAWGAGSSLEGNPIPVQGGIVLDFQQMDQILAIHQADFQVTVQPGVLYQDMNRTLARSGLFFAPDPGANASIGGMLGNNAAGVRTVKYGATKDNVLALEVVLASGEVIRTGSRSVKQSSGYDLTHLFVGSEGTLGIVTEATLKLAPLPEHFSAAMGAFPTVEAAADAVFEIMGLALDPAALELLDENAVRILNSEEDVTMDVAPTLFMEFTGPTQASLEETLSFAQQICEDHGCSRFQSGLGREARAHLWEARHRLFEIHQHTFPGQAYLLVDVAVPISQYPTLVASAAEEMRQVNATGSIISHAGDGNVHVVLFYPPDSEEAREGAMRINEHVVKRALELDGTITGEHGVGLGKRKFMLLEHGAPALNLMRQIKATIDPKGILNPGKVLPAE